MLKLARIGSQIGFLILSGKPIRKAFRKGICGKFWKVLSKFSDFFWKAESWKGFPKFVEKVIVCIFYYINYVAILKSYRYQALHNYEGELILPTKNF